MSNKKNAPPRALKANQILSQKEVDDLLLAIEGPPLTKEQIEEIENSAKAGYSSRPDNNEKQVWPYDLTSQDRIIRGRLPQLEVIYEHLMRDFRRKLSSRLRAIASTNITSTEFLKFGEFINTLPLPTPMVVVKSPNFRIPLLITMQTRLLYGLLDKFAGGSDRPNTDISGKDLSTFDKEIAERIVIDFLGCLNTAISKSLNLPAPNAKIEIERIEVNPQFVGIMPPTDVVVSSTFEVEIEGGGGTISLVFPYTSLEEYKNQLSMGYRVEHAKTSPTVGEIFDTESLKVDVDVFLEGAKMTFEELSRLRVGDEIPLSFLSKDHENHVDASAVVDGSLVFSCSYPLEKTDKKVKVILTNIPKR